MRATGHAAHHVHPRSSWQSAVTAAGRSCSAGSQSTGAAIAARHARTRIRSSSRPNGCPDAKVRQYVDDWRYGPCPICLREGRPVDVHASHRVVSLLFVTRWATRRHVCCRRCGRRKQALALLASATLGWWGLPWGIVLTPIQLARNLLGLAARDPEVATQQFEELVRRKLAARRLARAERGAGAGA
ncbi:hypothetical protein BCPG_05105 [Burkholderia cenocepacia PC184]|nr:hypothetical protein BCPG_05105 [Burkholderia cenocepacia PC184]